LGEGFWSLTRYEDVAAAAARPQIFSNTGRPRFGDKSAPPIEVDRPEHTVFRRMLQPYFRPDKVSNLESAAKRLANELAGPLVKAGRADLSKSFTYPYPARVLCEFLGLPPDDADALKGWADEIFDAMPERENDPARVDRAEASLTKYARDLVADRRARGLDADQDLITGLVTHNFEGHMLDPEEVLSIVRLLLSAGHNSTTSSLGIVLLHIAREPAIQTRLRADQSLIPKAIEEFLRHESPVMATKRTALSDVEIGGRQIHAGEQVFLVWSSANRDVEHYPNPEEVILEREARDHLVFGRGVHRCLGSPIALMELRVAVETFFELTTWFELDGPVERASWERYGVTRLPMRMHARELVNQREGI
jgi:cytochrome P450